MTNSNQPPRKALLDKLLAFLLGLPWLEILAEVWKTGRKLWRGMADEGMYEVLDYEATLELCDKQGKRAIFSKREKVRYAQDNIIAYQDQAWGDGDLFAAYHCSPGIEADRYRLGYKTYILISLRAPKKKGDVDEFLIEREIHDGFLNTSEYFDIEAGHRTRRLALQVIFPKSRRPKRVWLIEQLQRQTHSLPHNAVVCLPDGRWQARWEVSRPRLHEHYLIKWDW